VPCIGFDAGRDVAADAIETFDQTHGRVITRSLGAAQAAGGVLEAVGGVALAGGGALLSSTGVGAAPGLPTILGGMALAVNGVDNAFTGVMAALTGEFQHNQISEAAGGVAGLLGASPQTVESIKTSTDVASGLAGMGLGAVAATTRKAASSAVAAGDDLAVVAARRADEAAESADGIARPAKTTVGKTINQDGNNVRITGSEQPLPGTAAHKEIRWREYQERGGEWDRERWEKMYDNNMTRARKANEAVDIYNKNVGWDRGVSIMSEIDGAAQVRRIDIADIENMKGIEIKTGYQTATESNLSEIIRDKYLVEVRSWEMKWVFRDRPSAPLLESLEKAGIRAEDFDGNSLNFLNLE